MSNALELLRRRRSFRRLWLGSVASQLGDWIGWVAVAMTALQQGGGPMELAVVFAAHHLPSAGLAPLAGVLADRIDRRTLLWLTSAMLGLLTVGMAVAAASGSLLALQVLLLVRSAGVAFFIPAERAALPRVVEEDELLVAGALDSASWSVTFAVGMAVGGAMSMLGPTLALAIDAATFGVSALLFFGLPSIAPSPGHRRPRSLHGFTDALTFAWPRPKLRRAVFAKAPYAVAGGAAWIGLALQADALGGAALGGLGFGLLHAIRGIGTGIGPVIVAERVGRGVDRVQLWRIGYWTGLAGVAVLGFAVGPWSLALASLAWGLGGGTNWVVSTEQMQRRAPDEILARTAALDQIGMTLGMTLGVFAVAWTLEAGLGLGPSVLAASVSAGLGWWMLDRSVAASRSRTGGTNSTGDSRESSPLDPNKRNAAGGGPSGVRVGFPGISR